MVARGEDHPGHVRQAAQGVIQKANRIGGRDGAVVNVPGHDDGIDLLAAGELDEVVGEGRLGVIQEAPVEGAPQMPIGGVQDPHDRTLSQGCDTNDRALPASCPEGSAAQFLTVGTVGMVRIWSTSTRSGAKAASSLSAGYPSAMPTASVSSSPMPMTSRTMSGRWTSA